MKSQDLTLYALVAVAVWLAFFRKTDNFCGGCGVMA